ncbi:hypothetical protein C5167_036573 [Papaver somniferum]|uniref:Glycosyl transferase CAP10 domain-containing protein n=2 Tax=Papaver somniferum TaxID=3469 RepID=A0A4Y7I445_PAPSO|nr:hypothetical protein C5167_036573 [Papaver somniferum]
MTTTRIITSTVLFFFILFVGSSIYYLQIDISMLTSSFSTKEGGVTSKNTERIETPQVNCTFGDLTLTCPLSNSETQISPTNKTSTEVCPEYFRWIHEDLSPWRKTGISNDMIMRARRTAHFRLVIVDGKAYLETYGKAYQSRDTLNLWGILQLMRRYPGRFPDLDLLFDCNDPPVIKSSLYMQPKATVPPPALFGYCSDDSHLDIVFPDWSFWGWPEINIKPWNTLLEEMKAENRKTKWTEREPYAYWKGNPDVGKTRKDLLKCNVSDEQDWGARLYEQDWGRESQNGFQQSNLANQCTHRYKVYIEGWAWSVSQKYILACDSLTLLVKPRFYDFFTRGLKPLKHYWPIKNNDKCRSIKFAVDWGNTHEQKVQDIGKASSDFIQENLKMEYIYDYMFHLLNEYAKLLTYKPTIPPNAVEFCSATMACPHADGVEKSYMMDTIVRQPSDSGPCTMPPPFEPPSFHALLKEKEQSIKTVETWENEFWNNQPR